MLLSELLKGIDTKSNFNDTEITDITDNTAKLCEGCVFVCIKGAHNRERYYKCRDLCKSLAARFYIALNFCYHHSAPLTHTCRSLKFGNAAAGRL